MALVLRGVVVAPTGRPVDGARVGVSAGPAPVPDIAALTDPDGGFALGVPVPGTYEVWAAHDTGSTRATVTVTGSEREPVVLTLG